MVTVVPDTLNQRCGDLSRHNVTFHPSGQTGCQLRKTGPSRSRANNASMIGTLAHVQAEWKGEVLPKHMRRTTAAVIRLALSIVSEVAT